METTAPFDKTPLLEAVRNLPTDPGVYKFSDVSGIIIYVGKAKNLRQRVSSYFAKDSSLNNKTRRLVSEIRQLTFTVVGSEADALLLENNLIKKHQPKYNILLKDDKTYPYLCITNEPFPKLVITRKQNIKGIYFGPFTSLKTMYVLHELLHKLYTIRTCNLALTPENVHEGKFKVCLEYHIKNCQAPCVGFQSMADYRHDLEQASQILKGRIGLVKQYFKQQMQDAASRLAFEEAQTFKNKLDLLDKFQSKSLITSTHISDIDVVTLVSDEKAAYINYLYIQQGAMVYTHNVLIKKKLDESDQDLLLHALLNLREQFGSEADKAITNLEIPSAVYHLDISTPKIGDLRKLVEMSYKNVMIFKKDLASKEIDRQSRQSDTRILEQLRQDLRLPDLPRHIECFDNSNLQGTNPVASMVCFKNGKPAKKDYRHFSIQTVVGANDFASMHEIVHRRYKRLLEEKSPLPNLIVIDGGKGQLSAACDALRELGLYGQIPIISIAKRLEELYYPHDELPIHLSKKSESLMLIQRIRDEAHRFAITFHRDKRSHASLQDQLENIEGIGKTTVEKLRTKYRTIQRIVGAPVQELEALIGKDRTQKLLAVLAPKS
jgi:excinuclease ABC subunit C